MIALSLATVPVRPTDEPLAANLKKNYNAGVNLVQDGIRPDYSGLFADRDGCSPSAPATTIGGWRPATR